MYGSWRTARPRITNPRRRVSSRPFTRPPYDQVMTSLAHGERLALADLFAEVGPDAPTLCGDWTTRDLVAHLTSRERRADALPGLGISAPVVRTTAVRRPRRAVPQRPRPPLALRAAPGRPDVQRGRACRPSRGRP